jgi:hypothetical protein
MLLLLAVENFVMFVLGSIEPIFVCTRSRCALSSHDARSRCARLLAFRRSLSTLLCYARLQSARFAPSLSACFAVLLDRSRFASLDRSLCLFLAHSSLSLFALGIAALSPLTTLGLAALAFSPFASLALMLRSLACSIAVSSLRLRSTSFTRSQLECSLLASFHRCQLASLDRSLLASLAVD